MRAWIASICLRSFFFMASSIVDHALEAVVDALVLALDEGVVLGQIRRRHHEGLQRRADGLDECRARRITEPVGGGRCGGRNVRQLIPIAVGPRVDAPAKHLIGRLPVAATRSCRAATPPSSARPVPPRGCRTRPVRAPAWRRCGRRRRRRGRRGLGAGAGGAGLAGSGFLPSTSPAFLRRRPPTCASAARRSRHGGESKNTHDVPFHEYLF